MKHILEENFSCKALATNRESRLIAPGVYASRQMAHPHIK